GYDYLSTGQHFLADPFEMFQPLPLLARLAPETGAMRLHTTLLMPLLNPVETAELTATVDVMTGGRLILSAGRGYRDTEYEAFGVSRTDASGRMVEMVECLRGLWSGEEFSYHGRFHHLERVRIGILPLQRPHPELWMAGNADVAVRRAARLGVTWNINPHADYETIVRQVAIYRSAREEAGHDRQVPLPMGRELYCAPTRADAEAIAGPHLSGKYEAYGAWGQDRELPGAISFDTAFDELAAGRFIIGSPADCIEQLTRYAELGIGSCHLRMNWPGMSADLSRKSLELFAEQVLPELREL
ncbi:MAG: LLM class flavin-dependent oxidoreductase, partial [Actinobacteria bacterium]|nr:LLM class flavin-dependent oxidoreductase [Actinomycetota bacterium]